MSAMLISFPFLHLEHCHVVDCAGADVDFDDVKLCDEASAAAAAAAADVTAPAGSDAALPIFVPGPGRPPSTPPPPLPLAEEKAAALSRM